MSSEQENEVVEVSGLDAYKIALEKKWGQVL